ncbi:hypothetical protein [Streptomyces bacillaris]|uniref:hypothetical protein n=1 Tax=Streptomyces bacillaris TaxID=68179 RepID=UPI00345F9E68
MPPPGASAGRLMSIGCQTVSLILSPLPTKGFCRSALCVYGTMLGRRSPRSRCSVPSATSGARSWGRAVE